MKARFAKNRSIQERNQLIGRSDRANRPDWHRDDCPRQRASVRRAQAEIDADDAVVATNSGDTKNDAAQLLSNNCEESRKTVRHKSEISSSDARTGQRSWCRRRAPHPNPKKSSTASAALVRFYSRLQLAFESLRKERVMFEKVAGPCGQVRVEGNLVFNQYGE
jgi:hypothetical protein